MESEVIRGVQPLSKLLMKLFLIQFANYIHNLRFPIMKMVNHKHSLLSHDQDKD